MTGPEYLPRVLVVSMHCCTRVLKQVLALQKCGLRMHMIHNRVSNTLLEPMLPPACRFNTKEELAIILSTFRDNADVIHYHNEPNWPVQVIKEVLPDIPLVLDAHDLHSARTLTDEDPTERSAIELADAIIVPSKGYKEHIHAYYDTTTPVEVIYSFCTEEMFAVARSAEFSRIHGVVYEGGLAMPQADIEEADKGRNYRDWSKVARELNRAGIPFFLYPGDRNMLLPLAYADFGACVMPSLDYRLMLQALRRYDWALVGFPFPGHGLDWSMPNKLFEAIAAGVPPIVFNSKEAEEFVDIYRIGLAVTEPTTSALIRCIVHDQVHSTGFSAAGYRQTLEHSRNLFTMESQTNKIVDIYNKAF